MSRPALETAKSLLRRRNFSKAITILDAAERDYQGSFDYYLTEGIARLYLGNYGIAHQFFTEARKIRMTETNLLLGQAVLYLRRGDTDIALQYYLDILDYDPENKIAKNAMHFIRTTKGNYEEICNWVNSGKIQQFYPPLGVNPSTVARIVFSAVAGIALGVALVMLLVPHIKTPVGTRYDLTDFVLSYDDLKNLRESDLSGGAYRYILSDKELQAAHDNALQYLQDYRDNAATVEINRILHSNASALLRQQAQEWLTYIEEPAFDFSMPDNYPYEEVAKDPVLYLGCWVIWTGRVTNVTAHDDAYRCDLLIDYEPDAVSATFKGPVPLYFSPAPDIDGSRTVRVFAKIGMDREQLVLLGQAVAQPPQKPSD